MEASHSGRPRPAVVPILPIVLLALSSEEGQLCRRQRYAREEVEDEAQGCQAARSCGGEGGAVFTIRLIQGMNYGGGGGG